MLQFNPKIHDTTLAGKATPIHQSSNSNSTNLDCLDLPQNLLDIDAVLDDLLPLPTSNSEEPPSLDKATLKRKQSAERQRRYKERKKAESLAASNQLEQMMSDLNQLKLENRQISTTNKAMQILQDYKDKLIQLMSSISENVQYNIATALSMLNLQSVQDTLWEQFHHPPDIVVRTAVSFMNVDAFIENAKTFQARLAVLRCQLDQAPDDATRQRLERRLAVVMSFRMRCWEMVYDENPQMLQDLLLKASNDAIFGQPHIFIDETASSQCRDDSTAQNKRRNRRTANTTPHGGITFVFQCPVTSESRSLELSKQQLELLVPICEEYEVKMQKTRENLHKKVSELLVKHSVPIHVDDDPDEFIKKAIASHLSAVESVEVLEMEKYERNRAKLKLLMDSFKLLTPIQFCDTLLGSNWVTGVGFLAWAEALCIFLPQVSKRAINNGSGSDDGDDEYDSTMLAHSKEDIGSLFQWR